VQRCPGATEPAGPSQEEGRLDRVAGESSNVVDRVFASGQAPRQTWHREAETAPGVQAGGRPNRGGIACAV
jgi:hypothetical protein